MYHKRQNKKIKDVPEFLMTNMNPTKKVKENKCTKRQMDIEK